MKKISLVGKHIAGTKGENPGVIVEETRYMITVVATKARGDGTTFRVRKDMPRSDFDYAVKHNLIVIND